MKFFGMIGDRGEFRPIGRMTLAEGVPLVSLAILHAHEQKIRRLLINITGVTGIEPPTLADRYFMACEWAEEAAGGRDPSGDGGPPGND